MDIGIYFNVYTYWYCDYCTCRSQWPCGLRRRFSAARLLRSWFRILPVAWMIVCCECCVLSGRGLCDGLITRPEESYRLWRVVVCDQETSKTRRLKPATGLWKIQPQWVVAPGKQTNCLFATLFTCPVPSVCDCYFFDSFEMVKQGNRTTNLDRGK
jgi:hypothetical protein